MSKKGQAVSSCWDGPWASMEMYVYWLFWEGKVRAAVWGGKLSLAPFLRKWFPGNLIYSSL